MNRSERPAHLGPAYASQFADPSVVKAYAYRPPYPAEVFAILLGLVSDRQRIVLDLGCGRGEIARGIVPDVDRVDAVDPSAAMIAAGRTLPGGDHPRLRWICARGEDAPFDAPYALAAAGNSLHWMEWAQLFPRLAAALSPGAYLAVVGVGSGPNPWDGQLRALIGKFSTNREFKPYDLIAELEARGLFAREGRRDVGPAPYERPVHEYIESIHSQNGFSRDRMEPSAATAFDEQVHALVEPVAERGILDLTSVVEVTWGRPSDAGQA